jgi:hypothetical protein
MKRLRWIPFALLGLLGLLTLGALLLGVFESAPATATLTLSGHLLPGTNHYTVTLTTPSGHPAPTETVAITDSALRGCRTSKLSRGQGGKFTGHCTITDETTGDTVHATYNKDGGDTNYKEATSNTLRVPKPPPAVPTVSSVTPSIGPVAGGTHISITGTGFIPGATVLIDQGASTYLAATDVRVYSSTQIGAETGVGAKAGTWTVFVTTAGGTNVATPGDSFTYAPAPTVAAVSPNKGATTGGTAITVTGTGFVSGAKVVIAQGSGFRFNAIAATDVTVVSPDEITAITGGGAKPGTWNLYVQTAGGDSAGASSDTFTYAPVPTVASVTPALGPASGGTHLSITGTGFEPGATVVLGQGTGPGSATVTATDVKVYSSTKITAITGRGVRLGAWSVLVTTAGGTSSVTPGDAFTYLPLPTVAAVTPNRGPTSGGTPITITGSGFVSGATVTIGQGAGRSNALAATDVNVISPTEITAVSSGGAKSGTWHVYVTTAGGHSAASLGDTFSYAPVPTVSTVRPNGGPTSGGTPFSITGTGFAAGATVTISQSPGSAPIAATDVKVYSSTKITAVAGRGAKAGTWSVLVTTAGGTSAGSAGAAFTYR